jgi:hypothetical protein
MANEHIINNNLIVTGSVTASAGFFGDGSGLTGITATAEWDGSRNGDANITGSLVVSGSNVNVDFTNTGGVSGSFSGSYEGNGSGLTNLNLNGYQASGSSLSGSFSGSFEGDGSGLTDLTIFPYNGNAIITGSLTVTGSSVIADFTNTIAISGSTFSGSFVGDGSGLTNVPASEWDGSRNGDAEITGSFIVSGSTPTIQLLGDTTIDQNIEISNRDQIDDIAIGYQALPDTTYSGIQGVTRRAIAIGYQAATNLVSGSQNIYIGQCAGYSNVKGLNNLGIGFCALACSTGFDAGFDYTFANNLAIGSNALKELTTGTYNFAIGADSSCNMTTGTTNTTVGHTTGCSITNGYGNTLLGYNTGTSITTGRANTFLGQQSGVSATGNENTAVGYAALPLTTGDKNVAIGHRTATYVQGDSSKNIYIGHCVGPSTGLVQNCQLYIGLGRGETPLIRGDFGTGQLTIHSQVSASIFSGSFVGDGSGLTGISGDGFPYNGAAVISGSLLVSQSTAAGTAVTVENGHTILAQVSESLNYNNDTEAAAGGVPLGGLYRSGNFIAIRLT